MNNYSFKQMAVHQKNVFVLLQFKAKTKRGKKSNKLDMVCLKDGKKQTSGGF